MSVSKQLLEEKRGRARKTNSSLSHGLKFIAFHPTTLEKQNIRSNDVSYEQIFDWLNRCMERGLAVSLKRDSLRDCVCLVVREDKPFGSNAVAISFWHLDSLVCFQQMVVAFEDRYAGFPEATQLSLPEEDTDW